MEAIISSCGQYRYRLERQTCPGDWKTAVIMVNPSTADAVQDDATIRKLIGFGHRNRWGRVIVGNLFAYRATDVRELGKAIDPIGPENDDHLMKIMAESDQVIFAWGPIAKVPRKWRFRYLDVAGIASRAGLEPMCIGPVAKCGHPKHPLMLSYASQIMKWNRP
ncbi:DUF1643 domain-containing protein [Sphingobium yanoikuyae]|uniref:DUF1643 domain-containing protein n=1 Tax=Sphingobium yanoikuyae TaxID=13690 RepID=UPI0013786EF0|nr:DUF1643 domain-containing protein [Sphingobium yanoikuyae]NBB37679.1 DUF1643 domain-containing protein [Sphingobium yanoikuyae]